MADSPRNVFVRPMARQDLPRLVELDWVSNHPAWSLKMFERELELPFSLPLVAVCDGQVAAFVVAWLVAGVAQIQQLAVAPEFRRQGIAILLLRRLAAAARKEGCAKMELEVRQGNLAAKGLYERLGFKPVGSRKNFYRSQQPAVQPDEPAILMEYLL